MKKLLTCITLCFACLITQAGENYGVASELLYHWKGVPVTMVQLKTQAPEDDAFSIIKHEPTDQYEYGNVEIVSGTDAGLMYGVYTILRAQDIGDGCLCQTIQTQQGLTIQPRFRNRAAQTQWTDLQSLYKTGKIPEFAASCAKAGFNMLLVTRPKDISKRQYRKFLNKIKEDFARYHIKIHQDSHEGANLKDMVNTAFLEIEKDDDDLRFMASEWEDRMTQLEQQGVETLILPISLEDEGHPFIQANIYAFGRMSMDTRANPYLVAYEWLAMTYTENPLFVLPMREIMINSTEKEFNTNREAFETYVNT